MNASNEGSRDEDPNPLAFKESIPNEEERPKDSQDLCGDQS